MKVKFALIAAACALAGFLTGCASTSPENRALADQHLFLSFPEDAQRAILDGRVEVGFSEPMVSMALGRPSRKYVRRSDDVVADVWAYTDRRNPFRSSGRSESGSGGGDVIGGPASAGVGSDRDEDRLRVVFQEGRVVAIEGRES